MMFVYTIICIRRKSKHGGLNSCWVQRLFLDILNVRLAGALQERHDDVKKRKRGFITSNL